MHADASVNLASACAIARDQQQHAHHKNAILHAGDWQQRFRELAADLAKVQTFYDSLGGVVGYQLKCLELIVAARVEELSDAENAGSVDDAARYADVDYLKPKGPNLQGAQGREVAQRAAADGLRAMPELAEIYPLGGASRASVLVGVCSRAQTLQNSSIAHCRAWFGMRTRSMAAAARVM